MLQANEPYLAVLSLFCQCSSLLLSIADDDEFFEREHPFTIEGKLWYTRRGDHFGLGTYWVAVPWLQLAYLGRTNEIAVH